jgi:hypothetical protein
MVLLLSSSEALHPKVNPFRNGCLKAMAEQNIARDNGDSGDNGVFDLRVCNSDDNLTENLDCRTPTFEDYFEVRIASGDWDECKYSITAGTTISAAITQLPCTTNACSLISF